ncbi:hypothetical protein D3C71_1263050 [compost metagenome]
MLARVFRFRGRDGHDFGTHEGEHGGQNGTQHRAHAVWQEALGIEQMRNAADLTVRQEAKDRCQAENNKANDRQYFDQGEPELELTVVLHAKQVGHGQQHRDDQRESPDVHTREPGVQDSRGGVGLQRDHQNPEPPVQPADGETGPVTDRPIGISREGASVR